MIASITGRIVEKELEKMEEINKKEFEKEIELERIREKEIKSDDLMAVGILTMFNNPVKFEKKIYKTTHKIINPQNIIPFFVFFIFPYILNFPFFMNFFANFIILCSPFFQG